VHITSVTVVVIVYSS